MTISNYCSFSSHYHHWHQSVRSLPIIFTLNLKVKLQLLDQCKKVLDWHWQSTFSTAYFKSYFPSFPPAHEIPVQKYLFSNTWATHTSLWRSVPWAPQLWDPMQQGFCNWCLRQSTLKSMEKSKVISDVFWSKLQRTCCCITIFAS